MKMVRFIPIEVESQSGYFLESGVNGFLFFTFAGIIYGILIELFATKVFKTER